MDKHYKAKTVLETFLYFEMINQKLIRRNKIGKIINTLKNNKA